MSILIFSSAKRGKTKYAFLSTISLLCILFYIDLRLSTWNKIPYIVPCLRDKMRSIIVLFHLSFITNFSHEKSIICGEQYTTVIQLHWHTQKKVVCTFDQTHLSLSLCILIRWIWIWSPFNSYTIKILSKSRKIAKNREKSR